MYALRAMLKEYQSENDWKEYTATMVWAIGLALAGKDKWKFQSYVELKHPEKADSRTATDIKEHILVRLIQ